MNIMELGAIGELVGGIAVLATLIYLAMQVRQNTNVMRSGAFQTATSTATDWGNFVAGNSECLHAYRIGLENPDALEDDNEKMRFGLILNGLLRSCENIFFQYQNGVVTAEEWEGWRFTVRQVIAQPGFRMFWTARDKAFGTSFRSMIDAEAANATEAKPRASSLVFEQGAGKNGSRAQ